MHKILDEQSEKARRKLIGKFEYTCRIVSVLIKFERMRITSVHQ